MLPRLRSWLATATVVGGLIAVGVWAHDVRGIYLGLAILATRLAMTTYAVLQAASRDSRAQAPRTRGPSSSAPGAMGRATEVITATALVAGMTYGGVLAWQASPGIVSAVTGGLVAGILLLVALGLLACVGAIASSLWSLLRRMG